MAEEAPFQAIIVSAGGPHVPEALKQQLAIGGRLIVPVGEFGYQTLMRVRRTGEDSFEEEDFGAVAFVPLIGEEGWAEPERERVKEAPVDAEPSGFAAGLLLPAKRALTIQNRLSQLMAETAEPFGDLHELCGLVERFSDRSVVLLGEATHGTAEFYQARARITEMLVDRHGFNIVAVEADWPDAAVYDAYVRGLPRSGAAAIRLHPLPDLDVAQRPGGGLPRPAEGDQRHDRRPRSQGWLLRARYLQSRRLDRGGAALSRQGRSGSRAASRASVMAASSPWRAEPARYGRMALSRGYAVCEKPVADALIDLLRKRLDYLTKDGEAFFDAEQNARIVAGAEQYYRAIYYGDAASWNLRDQHMFDTLERLLAERGPEAKAVVWAHNSHIGNAAFTEMGQVRGEHNIGQLARQRFGDDAALIGFGTDRGTVAAASDWDGHMEIKRVRPARDDSYEGRSRDTGIAAFLLETGPGQRESRPRRARRAAARARHRRHLPARDRAALALLPGRAVAPIRCLDLVRRNRSRGGARRCTPTAPTRPIPSVFRPHPKLRQRFCFILFLVPRIAFL